MADTGNSVGPATSSSVSRGLDGLVSPAGGGGARVSRGGGGGAGTGSGAAGGHNGRMPGPNFSPETADRTAPRGTYLDITV
jgi:hypothetical protein